MTASQRRTLILQTLQQADGPLSATALARTCSVSRQIIVGDVALLRAAGANITATPRGYVLGDGGGLVRRVACVHRGEDMERELTIMVDNGCTVEDVIVEHSVYGQLAGQLNLSSRYDVAQFIRKVAQSDAKPLSALTEGIHLHTLRCPDEAAFERVRAQLDSAGFLVRE